ncbi:MAG: tetratricopeptide repeat protein [Acidobacteriota bacterium]
MEDSGPPQAAESSSKIAPRAWGGEPVRSRARWRWPALVVGLLLAAVAVASTSRLIDAAQPAFELPITGRLALLPFSSVTADPTDAWVETGLTEMVAETLMRTAGAAIVPPDRLRKVFESRDLSLHDVEARERARSLAFAVGADQVLDVTVRRRGDRMSMDLELFDASGSLAESELEGNDALDLAEGLVFAVGRALGDGREPRSLRQSFSRSEFLDRLYATGLHELHTAEARVARPYFEIALRHRSGFLQAQAKLADCVRQLGDLELAGELTRTWVREAQARGERQQEALGLRALALLAALESEHDKAAKLYAQAFALHLDLGDEPARAEVLFELARLALAEGETVRAEELYVERLGIQQSLGDRLGEADSLYQIGSLLLSQDDLEGAEQVLTDARELALQAGDVWTEMRVVASLGEIAHRAGDFEQAKSLWRRALTFYDQRDESPRRLLLSYKLAEALIRGGELDEAEQRLHEIRELASSLEDRPYEAKAAIGLAWLLLRTGYPYQAKPHLDRALELDRWLENRVMLQLVIAWYAYEQGNYPLALATQLEVKRRSPDRWAPFDEAFLQTFERAAAEGQRFPLPGEEGYVAPAG